MQNPCGIPFDGIHSYYIMLTHFRFCTSSTKVLCFDGSVESPIIVIFNDVLSLIKNFKKANYKILEISRCFNHLRNTSYDKTFVILYIHLFQILWVKFPSLMGFKHKILFSPWIYGLMPCKCWSTCKVSSIIVGFSWGQFHAIFIEGYIFKENNFGVQL